MQITIDSSEVQGTLKVLKEVEFFLIARDNMNASLHCSKVRYSALTARVVNERERMLSALSQSLYRAAIEEGEDSLFATAAVPA